MKDSQLPQFKNELEKLKKEIGKKMKELERVPELGEGYDPDIETQESEEFAKQLSMAQAFKGRLIAIDEALLKIDKETYGICEKCGKEISEDVLKLVPESELCQECKRLSTNFGTKK